MLPHNFQVVDFHMFDTLNYCQNSDVRYGTVRNKTDNIHINITFRRFRVTITIVASKSSCRRRHRRRHHHHHQTTMELDHLLTRSGLTRLEVPLIVSLGFFCLLVCSFLVCAVIYKGAFSLYVATNFFCIPVFCPRLGSYLVNVFSVYLVFSYIRKYYIF
jgi:hypothetical protein